MTIRAKAKITGDIVAVKALMKHPMETGLRVDKKTGEKIPAHHINEFSCSWKGNEIFRCNLGPAVSKNPYVAFKTKGPVAGDELTFASLDNQGTADTGKVVVK
ncbi:MAG: thiosulfate oxidation carrier complex protein SoxZ [Arenicella sp.]